MRADETVAEARRLWRTVGRENLMIKVPATMPGLEAIRRLTSEAINVNITLLFSQTVYEGVVEAYLSGLEELIARGGDPKQGRQCRQFLCQPHRHGGRQSGYGASVAD